MKFSFLIGSLLAIIVSLSCVQAASAENTEIRTVRAFLEKPDEQIDLAKVKLTIDHMIDPSLNVEDGLRQIDKMAIDIQSRLPANARSGDKIDALRSYIYQAGFWNDNNPFRYDLEDPFGKDIHSKLLMHYLATKKGNCVSMPVLFVILGQRIGLDITLSIAPRHLFVKFRDEMGVYYNLEATSGAGVTRDSWMRQQIIMSDTHPWSPSIPRPADSESDQNLFSDGDVDWASYNKVPLYLNAPSGVNRVVYPNGTQRVLP